MTQENSSPTSAANLQPSPAAQFQFRFERFSAFVEEYTSSISLEGMFLKTREPRPVGTVVAFDIRLADGFQLIHGQGTVVWMRPDGLGAEQPAGMGIRFQALSDKGRELILKILDEHLKAGGQPFEVSDVPPGGVSMPGQGGSGSTLGGMEFDAPWGSKLPDVPAEFLQESEDDGGQPTPFPEVSTPALGAGSERSPSPPLDDVFALPAEQGPEVSLPPLSAIPTDDAFAPLNEEEESAAGGEGAFELEAVPEFDSELLGQEGTDAALSFGDQQSLPGLEPLSGVGFEDTFESAEEADWDIQPAADFDEQPTLLGAGHDDSALIGDEEPTLMGLHSAATSLLPPTEDSPLGDDPSYGGENEGIFDGADLAQADAENPFAAETFPEPSSEPWGEATPTRESTPLEEGSNSEFSFAAVGSEGEELEDQGAELWNVSEPVPAFATDAAPVDPFATDAWQDHARVGNSADGESLVADSYAAPDSFAGAEDSAVSFGTPTADSWGTAGNSGDAFGAMSGGDLGVAGGESIGEFAPFEPTPQDSDASSSGVVEGGLVGPFQFQDYDLEEGARESGARAAMQRIRKPLLGLAAVAVLAVGGWMARGPVLELLGKGEPVEVVGPRPQVSLPGVAEENRASPPQLAVSEGDGEATFGDPSSEDLMTGGAQEENLEGAMDSPSEGLESSPRGLSSAPPSPTPEAEQATSLTSSWVEPRADVETTVPHAAPLPQRAASSAAPVSSAATVVEISVQTEQDGTLVVITLDGFFDPAFAEVDGMAWDADSERLILRGIIEPYYPPNLRVNGSELVEIRTGHHPGSELWVVFDLASAQLHLEPPRAQGNRIEILIRRP